MNPDFVPQPGTREMHRARQTVVVVDLVESVRLMLANESDVIDRWQRFIAAAGRGVMGRGRIVKSLGDGLLLAFDDVGPADVGRGVASRHPPAYALRRHISPIASRVARASSCNHAVKLSSSGRARAPVMPICQ